MNRFFCALCAVMALSSAAAASPATDLFNQAQQYLVMQYFGPSTVDIPSLVESYRAKLTAACADAPDTCGFDKAEPVIAQMMSDLKDGHAYYLSAEAVRAEQANRQGANTTPTPRVGFTHRGFSDTNGTLLTYDRLITNVVPGSPAERAGIRYGDRWIGADGALFADFATLESYNQFLTAFTNKVRAGESVTLSVLRGPERQRLEINLKGEIINLSQFPTLELRPDGIAIITLRDYQIQGVGQRLHDLLRQAMAANLKGVIFNMRGNGGGSAYEMLIAVSAFLPQVDVFRFVPRQNPEQNSYEFGVQSGGAYVRSPGAEAQIAVRVNNPVLYTGPLVTLVDGGCASGCEYFAAYMQRAKRGLVIGEATVGVGNTNTARFGLLNGGALGLPTLHAFWLDGSSLPSRITPDILTPDYELNLLNTGHDALFEKALEVMQGRITAQGGFVPGSSTQSAALSSGL